jgi:hypothetical protein
MPIESSFQVKTDVDGSVRYYHSLYREGPERAWAFDLSRSALQHDFGSPQVTFDVYTRKMFMGPPDEPAHVRNARKAQVAAGYQGRFANTAAVAEMQIGKLNQISEVFNALIIAALSGATAQNLGDSPKAWWDWWRDHNEYASNGYDVDRYYDSDTDNYYYGLPKVSVISTAPRTTSCFAKGTAVWTKTGQRTIETLELGDLVLAQNVETGELSYKPVIARTLRPPSEILSVKLRGEEIRTTRGHPFWVAGAGWQMAKELKDGMALHGVTGTARVSGVATFGQDEAFNLVVADFNTYFVGESGVLVHDNTPRTSTGATALGLAKK